MIDLFTDDCGARWTHAWTMAIIAWVTCGFLLLGNHFWGKFQFYRGKIAAAQQMTTTVQEDVALLVWQEIERQAKEGLIVIVKRPE